MFTKKAMYWDINNEIWELDCSCYSPKKNCNHKLGVLHGISATAVAGGGPVWLAVSTFNHLLGTNCSPTLLPDAIPGLPCSGLSLAIL